MHRNALVEQHQRYMYFHLQWSERYRQAGEQHSENSQYLNDVCAQKEPGEGGDERDHVDGVECIIVTYRTNF